MILKSQIRSTGITTTDSSTFGEMLLLKIVCWTENLSGLSEPRGTLIVSVNYQISIPPGETRRHETQLNNRECRCHDV